MRSLLLHLLTLAAFFTSIPSHSQFLYCRMVFSKNVQFQLRDPGDLQGEEALKFYLKDNQDRWIGTMEGFRAGSIASDFFFDLDPSYQRKGLSKEFVGLFLHRFPEVREIHDVLIDENLTVFRERLAITSNPETAVQHTPFVKAFAPHGFRATDVDWDGNSSLYVTLKRL